MKTNDIVVGGKYSNPTAKYGGVRIVDAAFCRRNGQEAVSWTNAFPQSASQGHSHGVSTLATFARWARSREEITNIELDAHRKRVELRALDVGRHGPAVDAFLDRFAT